MPDNVPLMTVKELCNFFRVKRITIYRLIKDGQLPAIKVGKELRFERKDIEQFISHRKFRLCLGSGQYALSHRFHRPDVLDKYRNEWGKYYLHEQAYDGRVGNKEHLYKVKVSQSTQQPIPPAEYSKLFADVHFYKVHLKDNSPTIVLRPDTQLGDESVHWVPFCIPKPDIPGSAETR